VTSSLKTGGGSPSLTAKDKTPLEIALAYVVAGIPVFPCRRNKRPYTRHGFKDASKDELQVRTYWQRWPNALIGMPTGNASGIAVLDLDVKNGKNGLAAVPDWEELTQIIARTQSGGAHLYFENDERIRCTSDKIAMGVDTRGEGGYVILPGVGGYSWIKPGDLSHLPRWPDRYLQFNVDDAPKPDNCPVSTTADPGLIGAALAVIPNNDVGWEEFNRIGMAAWAATEGSEEGYAAFDAWARKSQKYEPDKTRNRWEHYFTSPPNQIGAGTLFFMANEAQHGWRDVYDAELEELVARANREGARIYKFPGDYNGQKETDAGSPNGARDDAKQSKDKKSNAESSHRPSGAITLHWHGEQQAIAPRWLIRNRLPETGVALISGQWGTAKTFMLLEIAGAVILGKSFLGEPTRRRGGILIFAAEGASDLPIRLAALAEGKVAVPSQGELSFETTQGKDKPQPIDPKRLPIVWADQCPPLRNQNLTLLIEAAGTAARRLKEDHGLPLSIIAIDTMAAAASFKDENDNGEAQRAMNVLRQLSQQTGSLVIAVDHFGKEIKTGTRGASAKEAAADVVLALLGDRRDEGGVADLRLCLRKVRGGPSGREFHFNLLTKALGNDEEGFPIESCVVNWISAQEQRPANSSKARSIYILDEALETTFSKHMEQIQPPGVDKKPVEAVRLKVVQAKFEELYGGSKKAAREALRRAVKARSTLAKGVINGEPYLWYDLPF
jgi:Bifunctional DNA primase/polymerase, N-terminal/AAA domain/Primase C terminal 2 (PriCT-2)